MYFYADVEPQTILDLQRKLSACARANVDRLNLHIHSSGGSATLGLFAADMITNSQTVISTYIDGIAASSASLMAVSGHKRFMTKHSLMLMHQPSFEMGHAKYKLIEEEAYNLKLINDHIIDVYAAHSTMKRQTIEACLYNERYLTADECMRFSFVDHVI